MESFKFNIIELDFLSLKGNLLNISSKRKIAVYLPPSYFKSKQKYPVLYFLPGFENDVFNFLDGTYQDFNFEGSMNTLIKEKKIKEMIVVLFDCRIETGGAFYTNSFVSGNWEKTFIDELIPFIDDKFRTFNSNKKRGIAGHSMGAYASITYAMKYPELFSYVYAMSPGIFVKNGLENYFFSDKDKIELIINKIEKYKQKNKEEIDKEFLNKMKLVSTYGMAFSPNKFFPYFKYPATIIDEEIKVDMNLLKEWKKGYCGFEEKFDKYRKNIKKSEAIIIDYGKNDYFYWLIDGCKLLEKKYLDLKVNMKLIEYDGNHTDHIKDRLENYLLPFFSEEFYKNEEIIC